MFSSSGRGGGGDEVDEVELAEAASIPDPPNQPKVKQFFLLPPARSFRNDNWKRACETIEVLGHVIQNRFHRQFDGGF